MSETNTKVTFENCTENESVVRERNHKLTVRGIVSEKKILINIYNGVKFVYLKPCKTVNSLYVVPLIRIVMSQTISVFKPTLMTRRKED